MGVDVLIQLPDRTRVSNVAKVMGILAGNEKNRHPLPRFNDDDDVGDGGCWSAQAPVNVKNANIVGCADIDFDFQGDKRFVLPFRAR